MTLISLGITQSEEDLYRYFLRNPASGPESVSQALGIDRDGTEAALENLCGHKLVRRCGAGRITAIDPVVGIERLIEHRLGELNEAIRKVAACRSSVPALVEEARKGEAERQEQTSGIERLDSLDEIRARLDDLAFFAYHEMMALQPDGALTQAFIDAAKPLDLRCLRRGITMRTVVLREALDDPTTAAYLHEMTDLGAQFKVVDKAMDRMVIYDSSVAVVPSDPTSSARGALVVRQNGLVANMVAFFEKVWASADDLPGRGEEEEATGMLSDVEKQVLEILSRVDKDEVAAREMGVSIRTFRRYVADLLLRLGASNRFQAALMAKERGWM